MSSRKKKFCKPCLILGLLVLFVILCSIPFCMISATTTGNVALIKIDGVITSNGGSSYFGSSSISSGTVVNFIEDAEQNPMIEAIVFEINSPGGSAVASDEIATAIKKSSKPTVSVIRELGASGGYWIASSTDYIVANRMSITGSIGVISSYLEFTGLMDNYGVSYQRLVAGENKDMGSPYRSLTENEEEILQNKLDMIHDYFILEIIENRGLSEEEVRQLATGEFFLGVEAYQYGLVDALGDRSTAEQYLISNYNVGEISYVAYEEEVGLAEIFGFAYSDFALSVGEGIGNTLVGNSQQIAFT
ncbi:signal peptide peptidase SppA [archaeon]|nr:signal peptide peptidase SppA [archaeon]MBT3451234.1 signal peptide peptidase SppA [archaeon]MBT6869037.1 signal peptide peptidase SppA [archaeon]MBT7193625.1 signal peptide peptidase SppA [archaeon]MBT7380158.1 signal peptide peptidase SppA [archaeon]